jgi:6-phosphogluconate dehydrogenase
MTCDIGLIGMAVMGQNLALNINDRGYSIAVYNRTKSKIEDFVSGAAAGRDGVVGTYSVEEFTGALKRPRKIILLVKAGDVVDKFIDQLRPHLEEGDIIIDGGNSLFTDSARRTEDLADEGLRFVGMGVSGGEEGARHGPSLMPGGKPEAWPEIKEILQAVAARTPDGLPCCEWIGEGGAGHYVKMIHNGIEYGDMQVIAESYHLMRELLEMEVEEIQRAFAEWNSTELESYLIEITADLLRKKDDDGGPLVDKILDSAGQKGTGKWTAVNALEHGFPLTLITEAVAARYLSSMKDERVRAAETLGGPGNNGSGKGGTGGNTAGGTQRPGMEIPPLTPEELRKSLLAAKIISYTQGFMLTRKAAESYGWDLNFPGICRVWQGGCIIRSILLKDMERAFGEGKRDDSLLMDDYFRKLVKDCEPAWRKTVAAAALGGVPVPAMGSALSFYDGYRHARLPANLLQAQRDYFGAHTYERVDRPRGEYFHTDWTGRGGDVSSSTYEA